MIKYLKSLFAKKPGDKFVFFDGDNIRVQLASIVARDRNYNYKYIWVQHSSVPVSRTVRDNVFIDVVLPSCIGKESVDNYIAMDLAKKCAEGASEIYLFSNDADFYDIAINGAAMFPNVKFVWMFNTKGAPGKKNISFRSPLKNFIIVKYR